MAPRERSLSRIVGLVQATKEVTQSLPLDRACRTDGDIGERGHQLLSGARLQLEGALQLLRS